MRKLAALSAAAAALAVPAQAGAKLLVATYNEGLEPHAVLQGHSGDIAHPKRMRVEISGAVQGTVHGTFTIKCYRGRAAKLSRNYTVSGMTPASRSVPIRGNWDRCRVARASARYDDQFIEGWIQIRAWGTPR